MKGEMMKSEKSGYDSYSASERRNGSGQRHGHRVLPRRRPPSADPLLHGSQPAAHAGRVIDPSTGELRFAFLDATGISGPDAGHMHNVTLRFVDADHFAADWQFFEGGKPKMTESMQYTRVR